MKPRVEIKQRAVSKHADTRNRGIPLILVIDGTRLYSDTPTDAGEAIEINAAAERLVEEMRKVP